MRKRTHQRRGVAVSGRPIKPLKVMLRRFDDTSSPLYRDMTFYRHIQRMYTETEISVAKASIKREDQGTMETPKVRKRRS